ncbi:MAG TPA: hypothetical protein VLR26_09715, partial [Frankiaceae bacterium]|nr:hypothetical protein [Frankiaceae bacterium]
MADPATTFPPAVDGPLLDVDTRFAIVPEWVLDAAISDCALRLYAVLLPLRPVLRGRMPGRATLARRLRKQSVDTVDRAMKELVGFGAVSVEHRLDGTRQLTNLNLVRALPEKGGRSNAARPRGPHPESISPTPSPLVSRPGSGPAGGWGGGPERPTARRVRYRRARRVR